ncbi:type I restriction enzyme HsdR N-terminal domain-containing protein, partial [Vibrio parahaemolyticus]
MFSNFDFSILDAPDFKEDAVREELVLPIIKALGYSVTGDSRIIRSKSLVHPYVAIGSQQRKVSIVPDYVFTSDSSPYWILDAKSPNESILKSKHVEQAYSYAIHPEVRAPLYALCNGREFVLFDVKKFDPILHFKLTDIETYWGHLFRIL